MRQFACDKISIIVISCNVENYLEECINSVRNQTYPNIEIILVDDGSVDRSADICDNFASIDSRVKVVHKQKLVLRWQQEIMLRLLMEMTGLMKICMKSYICCLDYIMQM